MTIDRDTRAFLLLLGIFVAATMLSSILPQWVPLPPGTVLPSKTYMALVNGGFALGAYGVLGLIGLGLARRNGFAPLWPATIDRQRLFVQPMIIGAVIGLVFIPADLLFQRLHGLGALPHPPFPQSIIASIAAGIGEELMFRLFFISLWFWVLDRLIFRGRARGLLFWSVAFTAALVFALGHLPALMSLLGREITTEAMAALPPTLLVEVVLLNGALSLVTAKALRDHGFVAAAGIHFWADIVWHVVWGPFSG